MIVPHFDIQPQFKYMSYFIYTSHHFTPHGRYELNLFSWLNKLTSLPICRFVAQLVEHRTGIAEVTGSNPVEALIFFMLLFFQLLKLEKLLRWSFLTLTSNRSSNIWIIPYILHINKKEISLPASAELLISCFSVPKSRKQITMSSQYLIQYIFCCHLLPSCPCVNIA